MILFPNAKINIGLWVVEKRDDGYHNIETLFLPVGLNDVLEFVESKEAKPQITITGITLDSVPGDNLVVKAWELLHEQYKIPPVDIHLHKIIPAGAGLGGGSSDAAFMLKGLSEHFELNCSLSELENMAASLGSDCAFFVRNQPAIGKGRGELLQPVELDMEKYEIMIVNPGIHVSTKEAYKGIVPAHPEKSLRELLLFPISEWPQLLKNDFETFAFKKFPEIEEIKTKLMDLGALYAAMSGSGSSVFGIFKRNGHSLKLHEIFPGCFTWSGQIPH